ncbi:superoxide dismutase [Prauserella sp. PE36]|uniref:superoxide dismutase family protein n=1 Tax=Prauserella sp. PE36 TaxID=1504709 RepID=UPI000DA0F6D5|nr:superoxide dismutase family protein [Prauserella sp. PE36]PXY34504.1 superoxide dismutase [Prauserella coralliicola]RBM13036.1 superoxide dismutase [Prauserella sp. PE36]
MKPRTPFALFTTTGALAAILLAGGGQAAAAPAHNPVATAHGTFGQYTEGRTASTYDPELVPEGARAGVFSLSTPALGTTTKLAVTGLVPERHYGAHVHTKPCGATGTDAGPHFQHVQDPVSPSTDPAYANPDNEVWLDFTTDARGTGLALSHVDWSYGERRPASVVIHEHHTSSAPGEAGGAGARLACVNVNF